MLEEVLMYLNNWFVVGINAGDYSIKDGGITLPFLADGQYFRICGSVFNDGLHLYPPDDLVDEDFTGSIWALAVPAQLVKLADEIAAWQQKQGEPSPYTSESFGGYSYSKATDTSGVPIGWQSAFNSRLSRWKKLREQAYVQPSKLNTTIYRPVRPFGGGA